MKLFVDVLMGKIGAIKSDKKTLDEVNEGERFVKVFA